MKKTAVAVLLALAFCLLFALSACKEETTPASSDLPSGTSSDTNENEGQYIPDWD